MGKLSRLGGHLGFMQINPFRVRFELDTMLHWIRHTLNWLKRMRNLNGMKADGAVTFSQISNSLEEITK